MENETLVAAIIGLLAGIAIMRLLTYAESNSLKDQLQESHEENDRLVQENKRLREHNCELFDRLNEQKSNIPQFGKW